MGFRATLFVGLSVFAGVHAQAEAEIIQFVGTGRVIESLDYTVLDEWTDETYTPIAVGDPIRFTLTVDLSRPPQNVDPLGGTRYIHVGGYEFVVGQYRATGPIEVTVQDAPGRYGDPPAHGAFFHGYNEAGVTQLSGPFGVDANLATRALFGIYGSTGFTSESLREIIKLPSMSWTTAHINSSFLYQTHLDVGGGTLVRGRFVDVRSRIETLTLIPEPVTAIPLLLLPALLRRTSTR